MRGYPFNSYFPNGIEPEKVALLVGSDPPVYVPISTATREDGRTILILSFRSFAELPRSIVASRSLAELPRPSWDKLMFDGANYSLHRIDPVARNVIFHPSEKINPNTAETFPIGGDRPQDDDRCTCHPTIPRGCRIHDPNLVPTGAEEVRHIRENTDAMLDSLPTN